MRPIKLTVSAFGPYAGKTVLDLDKLGENSFGNSARKFLEMYLYFKYPTDEELLPKLKRFFEPEDVPPILINRLVNEDSHGPTPENSLRTGIDPETIPVAKKILQLLQKDSEQYSAFMESIS